VLAEELAWLRDERFDLDLVGFDASELERLLGLAGGDAAASEDEDEVPDPPEEPVSKPGDLWVLGNHRLLCGDATVLADVERVLGGQLADMTFCDPPYNVDYANSPKDKLRGKHRPIINDNLGAGFDAFLHHACANILSVTKGACYICMSSSELDTLQRAFRAAGGKRSTFVRIPSPSAAPSTSASMSRSSTAGARGTTATGAARGTRATCGSLTNRSRTTCIRP
jgi:hypothetical protein